MKYHLWLLFNFIHVIIHFFIIFGMPLFVLAGVFFFHDIFGSIGLLVLYMAYIDGWLFVSDVVPFLKLQRKPDIEELEEIS